jgi:hypothetical protein
MAIVEFTIPEFNGAPVQQPICISRPSWMPPTMRVSFLAGHDFNSSDFEISAAPGASAKSPGSPGYEIVGAVRDTEFYSRAGNPADDV